MPLPSAPGGAVRATPLQYVLPPHLRSADSRRLTCRAPLLIPGETETVARTRPAQRRIFLAGRACAREALHALGLPAAHQIALPRGPLGAPLWPPGVIGSISHCAAFSTAAVGHKDVFAGLGIDVEPTDASLPPGRHPVFTRHEHDWLRKHAGDGEPWDVVIRSAKWSLYKALAPQATQELGAQDVSVLPDVEEGTLRIRWESDHLMDGPFDSLWAGRFAIGRHYLATCVTRAAAPDCVGAMPPTQSRAETAAIGRPDVCPPLALFHEIGWAR